VTGQPGQPTAPSAAPSWRIEPYASTRRDEVAGLILGIQRGEFGLPITLADQPDLMDIPGFYLAGALGRGGFWTGLDADGCVVGTIAALNIGPGDGGPGDDGLGRIALRKMFVAPGFRGRGLAAALLATLLGWCAAKGVGAVFLGTTDRYLAAHRFYEKHGFARIARGELPPTFPVMAVDTVFYRRGVSPAA